MEFNGHECNVCRKVIRATTADKKKFDWLSIEACNNSVQLKLSKGSLGFCFKRLDFCSPECEEAFFREFLNNPEEAHKKFGG